MIKSVVRTDRGTVMVFDERGSQMSEYEGDYQKVRERILEDASPDTVFYHDDGRQLHCVEREDW